MINQVNQSIRNNNVSFKSRFDFVNINKYLELVEKLKPIKVGTDEIGDLINNGGSLEAPCVASCTAYTLTDKIKKMPLWNMLTNMLFML